VPSHVTAWLDARADSEEQLAQLLAGIERLASERADRDGTTVTVTAESVSAEVRFDVDAADRISAIGGIPDAGVAGQPWPVIPTAAGHDAGVVQASGRRSAMLFVRNRTGVSHSPAEHAEMADCLAGVEALAKTLAGIAGGATPNRSLPLDHLDRGGWP
jgi:N-carbamoyl-L-amino-acid hydrolase